MIKPKTRITASLTWNMIWCNRKNNKVNDNNNNNNYCDISNKTKNKNNSILNMKYDIVQPETQQGFFAGMKEGSQACCAPQAWGGQAAITHWPFQKGKVRGGRAETIIFPFPKG